MDDWSQTSSARYSKVALDIFMAPFQGPAPALNLSAGSPKPFVQSRDRSAATAARVRPARSQQRIQACPTPRRSPHLGPTLDRPRRKCLSLPANRPAPFRSSRWPGHRCRTTRRVSETTHPRKAGMSFLVAFLVVAIALLLLAAQPRGEIRRERSTPCPATIARRRLPLVLARRKQSTAALPESA